MREIEILVELKENLAKAQRILEKIALYKGSKQTIDTYYYDPLRENLKLNADNKLMECCRLREKKGRYYVTYKQDHYEEGNWVYSDEYETEVKDLAALKKVFGCLGLEELVVIDNIKHIYETPDYEIVLEEVKDLGNFMEVEAKKDDENKSAEEIKARIWEFITRLGLAVGKELNAGKPELLLNKKKEAA